MCPLGVPPQRFESVEALLLVGLFCRQSQSASLLRAQLYSEGSQT